MKKLIRSRKGFTLAEMILVVAIIVIIASAAAVGVVEKINRANAQAEAVQLHASGGVFWTVEGGKVVQLSPEEYDPSNPNHRKGGMMDMQFDEVKYIQGTVPNNPPQTYNPGGGDPIGPGGSGGSGGSGSAGQHTQSSSDMLKEFLEHYGIPYTENGGSITWNHDGDYGGQSFADAWNQWKKDHTNSTGGGSSSGGNNVSTGGSGSSGSGSGSTGGSGSSGSGSSGSSGSGNGNGSGNTSSVGADSSTVTLNAPSQYNLQAQNQSFSGNGQPITKLTITISDGAEFTNVSAYDNGGKYKMTKSSDNRTVTITFDSSLGWASPESTLKVGNIQWSGSQNVQITYGFEYA